MHSFSLALCIIFGVSVLASTQAAPWDNPNPKACNELLRQEHTKACAKVRNFYALACLKIARAENARGSIEEQLDSCASYQRIESAQCLTQALEEEKMISSDIINLCANVQGYFAQITLSSELNRGINGNKAKEVFQAKLSALRTLKERLSEVGFTSILHGIIGIPPALFALIFIAPYLPPQLVSQLNRPELFGPVSIAVALTGAIASAVILNKVAASDLAKHSGKFKHQYNPDVRPDISRASSADSEMKRTLLTIANDFLDNNHPEQAKELGEVTDITVETSAYGVVSWKSILFSSGQELRPRFDDQLGLVVSIYKNGHYQEDLRAE